jgi:K+-transporting ATPase KdpF subunit
MRRHVGAALAVQSTAGAAMTAVDVIGLVLAGALLVYLVVALLYPERFQ